MGVLQHNPHELIKTGAKARKLRKYNESIKKGVGISMKKYMIRTIMTAAAVSFLLSAAGYGVSAEEEASAAEQGQEEVQELKTIGEKAEGETVFSVNLTNKTGKDIVGMAVKGAKEEEYPENMLEEGDVFAQDEERILYYDSAAVVEANEAENNVDENRPLIKPIYTVQVTFADETVQELHSFPFGDVEEADLCQGEEVMYIIYTSVAEGTEINTEEAELMEKQFAEEMPFEPEQVYYDPSQIVYDVPVYQEPAAPEPAAQEPVAAPEPVYEEPAVQEPVYEEPVYEEPVYQEPVYEEPVYQEPVAQDPVFEPVYMDPAGDGCVTDGLTY